MKAAKKIMASALALTMAASAGIGALADTISASGGNATVPVTITSALKEGSTEDNPQYEAPVFSVTLPASLPLTINANGSVNAPTADAFKITNGSAGPVKVTNVEFVNGTDWSFVDFGSDFTSMQVDSNKLGLSLTASDVTVKTGDDNLKPNWTIAKDGSLPITAAAAASAVSQTVTEENAASVVFTVGWDAAETTTENENQTGGNTQSQGESQSQSENNTFTFTFNGNSYTVAADTTLGAFLESQGLIEGYTISAKNGLYGSIVSGPTWADDFLDSDGFVQGSTVQTVNAGENGVGADVDAGPYPIAIRMYGRNAVLGQNPYTIPIAQACNYEDYYAKYYLPTSPVIIINVEVAAYVVPITPEEDTGDETKN